MGKVPFIYPGRLFGTGAIKAQQCYLSLQKGLVPHRAEGKKGEERGEKERRPVEIGKIARSNCLSFLFPCLFFSLTLFLNRPLHRRSPPSLSIYPFVDHLLTLFSLFSFRGGNFWDADVCDYVAPGINTAELVEEELSTLYLSLLDKGELMVSFTGR